MSLELLSLLVLIVGLLLALAKVCRDVLILRQLRAVLATCTPEDRVRLSLQLTQALQGPPWHVSGFSTGGVDPGQPRGQDMDHQ
ncbi:hypothetical protein ABZ595_27110 [Streptomyces rubradiris]|uniref:hypothetical protein n=1 Tax=Streptomyces rubradiris TaxID=285531 RepID=UPI0033EEB4E8